MSTLLSGICSQINTEVLDRCLKFHVDVQERCHIRKGKTDDIMADFCDILFNLMSTQVEVLCPMWSALYTTRLDVYLNKFPTTARKAWPSTKRFIQSVKHASSQEVLFCQHQWKEQKTHTTYNSCIAEISVSTLSGCTRPCSSFIPKHRFH